MINKPILTRLIYTAIAVLILGGCATTSGARPQDMSAAEHRKTAQLYEKKAAEEEAKYDPNLNKDQKSWYDDFVYPVTTYNLTEQHHLKAEQFEEDAREHKEAAKKLEQFEEEECAEFPKSTRVMCPLIGNVERVENIDGGARLFFYDDSPPIKAIADHMRCHYAFGRKVGRKGMPDCPMYLKDLDIKISGDHSVDITSNDAAVVEKIRERSRHHVS